MRGVGVGARLGATVGDVVLVAVHFSPEPGGESITVPIFGL